MGRYLGLIEDPIDHALLTDLLNVTQGLLFDSCETARDIALGRLRLREVGRSPTVDHVLITIEHEHESLADFIVGTTCRNNVLTAREF